MIIRMLAAKKKVIHLSDATVCIIILVFIIKDININKAAILNAEGKRNNPKIKRQKLSFNLTFLKFLKIRLFKGF